MGFTVRAHAKINWAIDVLGRRPDGYHELDMYMQTVELCDELNVEDAAELALAVEGISFDCTGDNLITRAARALNECAGTRKGARMCLRKRIPVGAGLGGGSADCAAALRALNDLWGLKIPEGRLVEIGRTLGADVPFCMGRGLARVRGTGEAIGWLPARKAIPLVMIWPGAGLSTAEVYRAWDAGGRTLSLDMEPLGEALGAGDVKSWAALAGNALEPCALRLLPAVAETRARLERAGAVRAMMTGSGSAVFGAFETEDAARAAARALGPDAIFTRTIV